MDKTGKGQLKNVNLDTPILCQMVTPKAYSAVKEFNVYDGVQIHKGVYKPCSKEDWKRRLGSR